MLSFLILLLQSHPKIAPTASGMLVSLLLWKEILYMKGLNSLSPAKYKLKQIYPLKWSLGNVASTTTKKQGKDVYTEEGTAAKEKADPIVAFSRPPQLPPFLGPLIAFSLLETWSSRDGNDD